MIEFKSMDSKLRTLEPLNEAHKKRNEKVLKEAVEMWKNPPSIEQAKKQVAEVKADMLKDALKK